MSPYLLFLAGIACAAGGGEFFVRGILGVARWLRIPPGIVGATIAAFATSSPELAVAVAAATAGTPEIALGDSLGSNVVNVALILGGALSLSSIQSSRDGVRRDFPAALLAPAITAALAADGAMSRLDAVLLLSLFVAWLSIVIADARRQRDATGAVVGERTHSIAILECGGGLLLLVAAGKFIVAGAGSIAMALGLDAFIVGALIVALGTSVPELATTIIATLRGHHEIGLGTIFGSNLFNGLFIVGTTAAIAPMWIEPEEVLVTLGIGMLAVAVTWPDHDGRIGRHRGIFLLLVYVVYVTALAR